MRKFEFLDYTYKFITAVCAAVHLLYAVVFHSYGIIGMVIFNAASFCLYTYLTLRINSDNSDLYLGTTVMEIMLHASVATVVMGWDYGFAMQLLAIIPVVMFIRTRRLLFPILWALTSTADFLILRLKVDDCVIDSIEGFFNMPAIYQLNSFVCFFCSIIFSLLFVHRINTSSDELIRMNDELRKLADFDPLTGVMNRRCMYKELEKSVTAKNALDGLYGITICDIDDFKLINDAYGHDCGDMVLAEVASILKEPLYQSDAIARWGGEEFLILLHDSTAENIRRRIEAIRQAVDEHDFVYNSQHIHITMTFGVEDCRTGLSYDKLIIGADKRLYEGKRAGKNVVFSKN